MAETGYKIPKTSERITGLIFHIGGWIEGQLEVQLLNKSLDNIGTEIYDIKDQLYTLNTSEKILRYKTDPYNTPKVWYTLELTESTFPNLKNVYVIRFVDTLDNTNKIEFALDYFDPSSSFHIKSDYFGHQLLNNIIQDFDNWEIYNYNGQQVSNIWEMLWNITIEASLIEKEIITQNAYIDIADEFITDGIYIVNNQQREINFIKNNLNSTLITQPYYKNIKLLSYNDSNTKTWFQTFCFWDLDEIKKIWNKFEGYKYKKSIIYDVLKDLKAIPRTYIPYYYGDNNTQPRQWDQNNINKCICCYSDDPRNKKYTYYIYKENNTLYINKQLWQSISTIGNNTVVNEKTVENFTNNCILLELQGGGGTGQGGNEARGGGGGGAYLLCSINLNEYTSTKPLEITLSCIGGWSEQTKEDIYNQIYSYLKIKDDVFIRVEHGFNVDDFHITTNKFWVRGGQIYLEENGTITKCLNHQENIWNSYNSYIKLLSAIPGRVSWEALQVWSGIPADQFEKVCQDLQEFGQQYSLNPSLYTNENKPIIETNNPIYPIQLRSDQSSSYRCHRGINNGDYSWGGGASVLGNGGRPATAEDYDIYGDRGVIPTEIGGFGGGGGAGYVKDRTHWMYGSDGQPSCFILHW